MLTWTDGLVLFKNRKGPTELAYEFINAYMTPEVGIVPYRELRLWQRQHEGV